MNERKEGRKKNKKKERWKKAYFCNGMTNDDFRVHVNDTTRVEMTCL
jgi:hypothetical protein